MMRMLNKYLSSIEFVDIGKRAVVYLVDGSGRRKWVTAPVRNILFDKDDITGFVTDYTEYRLKNRVRVDFIDTESAKVGNKCFCIINGESISTSPVIWSYVTNYFCEVETKNTIYYQDTNKEQ